MYTILSAANWQYKPNEGSFIHTLEEMSNALVAASLLDAYTNTHAITGINLPMAICAERIKGTCCKAFFSGAAIEIAMTRVAGLMITIGVG